MGALWKRIDVNLKKNMRASIFRILIEGATMKKGQIVEGTVKRVKFPNKGVIEIPGEEKAF